MHPGGQPWNQKKRKQQEGMSEHKLPWQLYLSQWKRENSLYVLPQKGSLSDACNCILIMLWSRFSKEGASWTGLADCLSGWGRGAFPVCSFCWFLWHKYNYQGQSQATKELSLDRVGKRWLVLAVAAGTNLQHRGHGPTCSWKSSKTGHWLRRLAGKTWEW